MNFKILIYGVLFMVLSSSCNKEIINPETVVPQSTGLKSASIGTYYVSKTGSDSNAGTIGSPFLTIQKAADIVNPGDVVIVGDGEYSTSGGNLVQIIRSGTANNYITFKSNNKWGAILNGNSLSDYAINIYNGASYIKFIDFEIKNFQIKGYINNDGTYGSNYITIQGNKIHDIGRLSTTQDIGLCAIKVGNKSHHWSIDKNLMYNIGRTGPDTYWMNKDHAIYTASTSTVENAAHHINITNNIMYGISGVAITSGSNNDLIANNIFAWTNENSRGGSPFIAPDSDVADLTIANNIFYQPPVSNPYAIVNLGNIIRWSVKNNMVYGGRMWEINGTPNIASMAGGNYGQNDCEHAEIDPKLVSAIRSNAPNVDFSLQTTSPAINAGVNVGLTTDYLGNVATGLPDIGPYEYTVSTPSPTLYYNVTTSGTTAKNDCGTGYTGSIVTYTVLANKYSSLVSQVDADNKAIADLNSNKQIYANANGICTIIPQITVYYNTGVSATITKKSCGTGYIGSLVTYSVSTNKYSSTVSQADADNKALADLANNKQAYADANGTCTSIPVKVYYNTQVSKSATKNTCGNGYMGSKVTYTVNAGKYSSTVSQTDANAKAAADLNNNKQAYANANGICVRIRRY